MFLIDVTLNSVSESCVLCDTKAVLTVQRNETDNTETDHSAWSELTLTRQESILGAKTQSLSIKLSPTEKVTPPNPSKQFLPVDQRNTEPKANKSLFLPFRKILLQTSTDFCREKWVSTTTTLAREALHAIQLCSQWCGWDFPLTSTAMLQGTRWNCPSSFT